jgi:cytidine deaminase
VYIYLPYRLSNFEFMPSELTIHISIRLYAQETELAESDLALLQAARQALRNAYAPYSRFRVGAALRLSNGQIVWGNNQENAAFPSGLCAERVAVFAAAAHFPDEKIEKIAIAAQKEGETAFLSISPCGACRQSLLEYESRQQTKIPMLMESENGQIIEIQSIADLLPFQFTSKQLNA